MESSHNFMVGLRMRTHVTSKKSWNLEEQDSTRRTRSAVTMHCKGHEQGRRNHAIMRRWCPKPFCAWTVITDWSEFLSITSRRRKLLTCYFIVRWERVAKLVDAAPANCFVSVVTNRRSSKQRCSILLSLSITGGKTNNSFNYQTCGWSKQLRDTDSLSAKHIRRHVPKDRMR